MRPRAVVFDLDGTLVDSRADIRTAVNRTRAELGLPPHTLEAVVGMVGEGAKRLLERAFADWEPLRTGMSTNLDSLLVHYLRHYEKVCLDETEPYPGIPELLAALAPRLPLAVLTNKGEDLSRRILEGLGLAGRFREILGGDSLPTRKPDPAGLLLLAERLGLPAGDLILVGDSWIDAATARNAGCSSVLVEWGFPPAEETAEIEADLRIAHPAELLAALDLA